MFGIGSTELIIILVVALIVIGPQKLPDLMRTLGKGLSEFRSMSNDVKRTLDQEIASADEERRKQEVSAMEEKRRKEEQEASEKSSTTDSDNKDSASDGDESEGRTDSADIASSADSDGINQDVKATEDDSNSFVEKDSSAEEKKNSGDKA